jgi:hypothetical protein
MLIMNARAFLVIVLSLLIQGPKSAAADAKTKLLTIKPSKVDRTKNKDREKLFGGWMSMSDFKVEVAKRITKGEKLLYFECEGGKDQWRGIFVPRLSQESPYFMAVPGEKEAVKLISEYVALGYTPRFVVVNKNFWCFTLSKGFGTQTEAEDLANLGIGPPGIK